MHVRAVEPGEMRRERLTQQQKFWGCAAVCHNIPTVRFHFVLYEDNIMTTNETAFTACNSVIRWAGSRTLSAGNFFSVMVDAEVPTKACIPAQL
jgi:hypothetical protein